MCVVMGEPPPLVFIVPQLILEGDGPSHYTNGQKSYGKALLRKPIASEKAIAIGFCNAKMLVFGPARPTCTKRSFSQNADRAMALYSLRSQRFHRLSLSCAYRRPEGSRQQGHQQDQQDCKVKPQIIRLHPVQLTA
jgi:hypothetical protein